MMKKLYFDAFWLLLLNNEFPHKLSFTKFPHVIVVHNLILLGVQIDAVRANFL